MTSWNRISENSTASLTGVISGDPYESRCALECILRPFGATFEREDKLRFKQLSKALQDVQKCAKRTTLGLYKHQQADEFAEDCDWWYNMVRLLADRTGDDELKTLQVINWLTTMPSQMHMFDVKKRDFKKIKL